MPHHDEYDRHNPTTGAALFPTTSMERRAGPPAHAISSGRPMTIGETAHVDLRSTRITDLEQNTIEIVAADHSESDADRIQGQLVGRVASITMDVVLRWENGNVQRAEWNVPHFADWDGNHAVLVWMTSEPPTPERMREWVRESLGDALKVKQLRDLVDAALGPEGIIYEFRFPQLEDNGLPELAHLQVDHSVSSTVHFRGNEYQATRIAKVLYGDQNAAEMVRMSLIPDFVSPDFMHEDLRELARLHSEETGVDWVPLPAAEIPLHVFQDLLEMANAGYLQSRGMSFNLTPAAARDRSVNFELALRRR